jgi:hemoglobin
MKEQQIKRPGAVAGAPETHRHEHGVHDHSHRHGQPQAPGVARVAMPALPSKQNPGALPPAQAPANPHYAAVGGADGVRRLVERFYALMDELPQARALRALHPADLGQSKERLFMFLSGWLGGPGLYAERFGPPRLRGAHAAFPVDEAARDAWMNCMSQALQEQVVDEAPRAQLIAAFFKTADFLRN